ncbi:RloB family protein [Pseudomonas reactans]
MDLRQRKVNTKATKKKILIVCEGERTEPSYFKSFRVLKQCEIVGSGSNTISVVNHALKLMSKDDFLETWCVFDRDSFPKRNVKRALQLADQNNIKVAFSNESFELWYVLHFEYLDTKITRTAYCNKLSELTGKKYKKNDSGFYKTLLERQKTAVTRAKTLESRIIPVGGCTVDSYPYTTVYKLVERLNKIALKS